VKPYPKSIRRLLSETKAEAYERELHRELTKLDASFEQWRRGEIGSGELSYRVHQYERGPSRDLYKRYNARMDDVNVAYAIVHGILQEQEVPQELLEALDGVLQSFRRMKEDGQLREPGE
jgi:hypothetical protein